MGRIQCDNCFQYIHNKDNRIDIHFKTHKREAYFRKKSCRSKKLGSDWILLNFCSKDCLIEWLRKS